MGFYRNIDSIDLDMLQTELTKKKLIKKLLKKNYPNLFNTDMRGLYVIEIISDKEIWNVYYKKSYFANLIQSWNYGEAKAKLEGWKVKRGVIKKKNVPIALCQWLEKSILKVGRIIRINRGPLWLSDVASFEEQFSVYRLIGDYFNVRRRCFLFISPSLEENN